MPEMGIKSQYVKPYTDTTIDSNFSEELINILNEEFNPVEPNAVWHLDITCIWTFEGFVYLISIMDLYFYQNYNSKLNILYTISQ
ncbi:hypothetical protein [Alkaliphilus serpentinus]|uniref:Transposase n=1 Tax=Alkaliphilus serpentinus TaxID=1482731 RepID=A0A833MD64_9FIRM|nr:hypothetical protein [Alkaliphilus serpentinus]KAB3527438.1 hypothetical protein F8153_12080 [Alkaliphilus serpentinus]